MRLLAAVIVLVTSLFSLQARAEDPLDIRLVDGGYSGSTGTALLGLEIGMPDGWHTYWKTAGEGGFGPEIDSSASSNLGSLEVKWPAPQKIETPTVPGEPNWQTNGYLHRVILPILVRPGDKAKDIDVDLSLRVYACKDYCAAFERKLTASVKPGSSSPSEQRRIAEWLKRVPRNASEALRIGQPESLAGGRLSVDVTSASPIASGWLHVSNADNLPYTVDAERLSATQTRFVVTPQDGKFEKSGSLEFVATADGQAVTATFDRPVTTPAFDWSMILTAFLGGLVLNVMPCVFPVLSLKLMALTAGDTRAVRIGFAASSLGIIGSFLTIAAVLAGMKAAGAEIGWGIQFQNPAFLSTMTVVVLAFALGTAGLFEIALPQGVATKATNLTDGHGFGASLAQGFVATLLATPCSAPFVGTAVGFALAAGTWSIIAIFAAMGVGMAFPYLLIALTPGLSRLLPKPGAWMQKARLLLSLALFATAGWLALTLSSVWSVAVSVVVFSLSFGAIVGASIRWADSGKRGRGIFVMLAALSFSGPIMVDKMSFSQSDGIAWTSFRPGEIQGLVAEGKTVLVYMTADWCITCKVNDRTTWRDDATVSLVNRSAVAMKADWTRPDPVISEFLKENGRFGIPFTVIYTPDANRGTILPEILTPGEVGKALKR
ncbi:thioredoxin family protein [Rhizobium sp. BK176]|uniref:protein-disulfide reductase DsbD family protein n=1 Tax=Rhizobium sp. BK176 TaxID=2587071 RepID=UPI0021680459|nr:thioredoxin family protein [Rhizobium sp. BK176]MCS4090080.1 suppressor for copper-sensitivity B [Rhizobium sp. BK176]